MNSVKEQLLTSAINTTSSGITIADARKSDSPLIFVNRAFEPFYTTKPPGAGTGLGLSMALNAFKAHQGFSKISSTKGCGTTVHVFLPTKDEANLPCIKKLRS